MRVARWNPEPAIIGLQEIATERLVEAAEAVAVEVRRRCPVGTISRPMYRRGPYAGQPWTARDAGQLKKSIRVTQKKLKGGRAAWKSKDVRIYAGHYLAWYANIVEHSKPFMRPAVAASLSTVKSILGVR